MKIYKKDKNSTHLFPKSGRKSVNLPKDVIPCLYIESTGEQYIDLGMSINKDDVIDIDYEFVDDSDGYIFGTLEHENIETQYDERTIRNSGAFFTAGGYHGAVVEITPEMKGKIIYVQTFANSRYIGTYGLFTDFRTKAINEITLSTEVDRAIIDLSEYPTANYLVLGTANGGREPIIVYFESKSYNYLVNSEHINELYLGGKSIITYPNYTNNIRLHIEYGNVLTNKGDSSITEFGEFAAGNLYLFAVNNLDVPEYNSKVRIYSLSINNKINLIPILDANRTPCLYDTISGNTYYNSGEGDFLYKEYSDTTHSIIIHSNLTNDVVELHYDDTSHFRNYHVVPSSLFNSLDTGEYDYVIDGVDKGLMIIYDDNTTPEKYTNNNKYTVYKYE